MIEYKFRAKNSHSDEWVYGNLVNYGFEVEIQGFNPYRRDIVKEDEEWDEILVDPETIGQFTGLLDKNGKEIYEDDIVEWQQYSFTGQKTETIKGVVYFDTDCGAYGLRTDLVEDFFWLRIFYNEVDLGDIKVIGNKHDNKELLKKEA